MRSPQSTAKFWRVREYRAGDETPILDLFNRVFGESSATFEPRTMELWRWQYQQNPLGHHTVVAEDTRGQIVGNYSSVRVPFLCAGHRTTAAQGVDVCVASDYRGTGLFRDLASTFVETFVGSGRDVIQYGYPNREHLRASVRHYVSVHRPVRKMVKEFDSRWIDHLERRAGDIRAREVSSLEEGVDDLWNVVRVDHDFAIWRDAQYLRWRYQSHPLIPYRYLYASGADGALVGLLVMRLGWFGHPVVPLVDWVIRRGNLAVFAALMASAARMTLAAGGSRLEAWAAPAGPEQHDLASLGFASEETPFHLMISRVPRHLTIEWMRDHWFYTMGDADFY